MDEETVKTLEKLEKAIDIIMEEKNQLYCEYCERWHDKEETHSYCWD